MFSSGIRKFVYALLLCATSWIIYLSVKNGNDIITVITNLCYSVWGAAIMGLLIEISVGGVEKSRIKNSARVFLSGIYSDLSTIIGTLIWLDERIKDDDFKWNLDVEQYFDSPMEIEMLEGYGPPKHLEYSEAKEKLKKIGEKCSSFNNLSSTEISRRKKMFQIAARIGVICFEDLKYIRDNALLFEANNIISIEKIDKLCSSIHLANSYMHRDIMVDDDYTKAINNIIESFETINNLVKLEYSIPVAWSGGYGNTGFGDIR